MKNRHNIQQKYEVGGGRGQKGSCNQMMHQFLFFRTVDALLQCLHKISSISIVKDVAQASAGCVTSAKRVDKEALHPAISRLIIRTTLASALFVLDLYLIKKEKIVTTQSTL